MKALILFLIFSNILLSSNFLAQDKLYQNTFPLSDIILLEGPFQHARDINIEVLLKYNIDRLLAPYRKEARLVPRDSSFTNWLGLDGHIGGHYLSALAINYAATNNSGCKERMEYMISELKACQEANSINNSAWGKGYVGGVPNSNIVWTTFKEGDFKAYQSSWVPWYNVHKMYAGLRDAWLYTSNEDAKNIFLKFCDWGIDITSDLTDEQMELMLNTEHGGMNEIFADAHQMTGNERYLKAAKRFSHKALLEPMANENDNLDNKHANTQIPKIVGFQRIAELSNDKKYSKAASFFWETVTNNRSLAFGGNSRKEHFPSVSSCSDFINDVEGPESCNSYNMLKLTEDLFRVNLSSKYIDFYERTLYNHILSTQHPEHGGYVYFTSARPRHYRVYSAPNQAMWCCVGSGMENHGKYNQLIYTHKNDSLFLNLFIPSELNWKDKGIKIKQETNFPYEDRVKLTITQASSRFNFLIRYPSWVAEKALKIIVNNDTLSYKARPSSYIAIDRLWNPGDVVEVILPMHHRIEKLPNVSTYIAFLYGPILLAAKTGNQDLTGLIADDSRWGHIANGERLPIDKAPIIVEHNLTNLTDKLVPVEGKSLTFSVARINMINSQDIVLEPFFKIHDARYIMYWLALSDSQYKTYLDSIAAEEKERLLLQKRTVDFVATGEQQPEADHGIQSSNSSSGNFLDSFWRDAKDGGFFSYNLTTNGETNLSLMIRYWGYEWGDRKFDIYLDDKKLISEDNTGKWYQSKFQDIVYQIPDSFIKGKKNVKLKFQALQNSTAGAVYYIRLLRQQR